MTELESVLKDTHQFIAEHGTHRHLAGNEGVCRHCHLLLRLELLLGQKKLQAAARLYL